MLADITPTQPLEQFPQSPHSSGERNLTNVALVTGMDLAMGSRIDQPLTEWEDAFIPMQLQKSVRNITVTAANGQQQPLVLSERVMFDAHRPDPPAEPPQLLKWYIIAGLLIAGLIALGGSQIARGWGRALFFVLAGIWTLVIGLLGTLIAGLWLFTDHVATYGNENLLQANPLALLLFVALIGLLLKQTWARRIALRTGIVLAGLSIFGFLIPALPGADQVNGTIIALLLPANVVIAWVLWRWLNEQPKVANA
jgi:hypothetical protein